MAGKVSIQVDEAFAMALFNDILDARTKGLHTILINEYEKYRFLDPMEIVDCSLTEIAIT